MTIVRAVQLDDVAAILEIYNHYVITSHATFELELIGREGMEHRIRSYVDQGYPYLVADDEQEIIGYAFAHRYRPRPAYAQTVEVSVYTKPGNEQRGVGSLLYGQLIPEIFAKGFHAITAGIALPNDASIRLHEKFGFEKVAHFREVGYKFDRWIDVRYWQLMPKK